MHSILVNMRVSPVRAAVEPVIEPLDWGIANWPIYWIFVPFCFLTDITMKSTPICWTPCGSLPLLSFPSATVISSLIRMCNTLELKFSNTKCYYYTFLYFFNFSITSHLIHQLLRKGHCCLFRPYGTSFLLTFLHVIASIFRSITTHTLASISLSFIFFIFYPPSSFCIGRRLYSTRGCRHCP